MIKLHNLYSKDNFWNLMFWAVIPLSVFLAETLDSMLLFLGAFTIVPYLLVRANKVEYTHHKGFLNKSGIKLNDKYPKKFPFVFIINIFFSAALISKHFNDLSVSAILAIALTLPTLYFIFKNCPISILFNKHAWTKEVLGVSPDNGQHKLHVASTSSFTASSLTQFMRENPITDVSWSGSSSNIHNSNRR